MYKYKVTYNQKITPTTLLLTLKKEPGAKLFTFQPGQYAAISFLHHRRPTPSRCFSIVSSPTDQENLQFSMRTKGHFTKALTGLKAGDKVTIRGPFGGFVFDTEQNTDTVLLAGGIGITPFMSMIRFAAKTNLPNSITLLFSCATQDDVPFVDELKAIEKQNPHFKVIFIIGQGPVDKLSGTKVATGRITPEIIDGVAAGTYAKKDFFICGPPPFMKGMQKILQAKGVSNARIITEAFSQGPNRQTGKIRSWPFNIYILSAIGVTLGSFVVLVSDLLKTLPPSTILNQSSPTRVSTLTNSRQTDLDSLVNNLPAVSNSGGPTNAVTLALQQAAAAAAPAQASQPSSSSSSKSSSSSQTTQSTTSTTTAPSASSTTTTTTSTPAPAPAPAPAPPPVKKCTTTQSGVTTCV